MITHFDCDKSRDVGYSKDNEKFILENGTPSDLFYFAKMYHNLIDLPAFEDAMVKSGSAKYAFYIASDVPGANIKKMEAFIMSTNSTYNMFRLAKYITDSVNVLTLAKNIVLNKDAEYAYKFYKEVPSGKFDFLKDFVLSSGNDYIIKNASWLKKKKTNVTKNKFTKERLKGIKKWLRAE